jgi:hypothetical protein
VEEVPLAVALAKRLSGKQAGWLERVLAEEHERNKKHLDRIELPD